MTPAPYGAFRTRANELMKPVPISRIQYLMSLPGDALVRLYSYQGQAGWDRAEALGYWSGNPETIHEDGEQGWGPAYDWMRERMAERVPDFSGDYPMWGWTKRPSTKPKPRKYRGTSDAIRLTVLVPRERIVFSDYDAWHSVLNRGLNCATEEEWDAHSEAWPYHWSMQDEEYKRGYLASIEPSWHRCLEFQPNSDPRAIYWSGSTNHFRVQACVDRFHWNEIVGVRRFDK